MSANLLTIIPPIDRNPTGPMMTRGTIVRTADGKPVSGVTRIELIAELNDVWRAKIECHVRLAEMPRIMAEVQQRPLTWWQRICLRMAGCHAVDITSIADINRLWARIKEWF